MDNPIPIIDNTLTSYGWLATVAILGLTIYTTLLLGWSANSSYSLVGSLRSSSALISYELILATSALLPMILSQSYNLADVITGQDAVMYFLPLLPVVFIFIISILAETSRVPFDLTEANRFGLPKCCCLLGNSNFNQQGRNNSTLRDLTQQLDRLKPSSK
jgi:NADH:ubiquinone oxidoreductase subunit H